MIVAYESIKKRAGDTIQRRVTVTDADGVEINLSSHTVVAALVDSSGTEQVALSEGSGIAKSGGKIDWTITDEQSIDLDPGNYVLGVKVQHSDGREFTVAEIDIKILAQIVD